jgi:hypothetical protein
VTCADIFVIARTIPCHRVDRVARTICDLFASPMTLATMLGGAISRANAFVLSNRVAQFYRGALSLIEFAKTRLVPAARSETNVAVASTSAELGST